MTAVFVDECGEPLAVGGVGHVSERRLARREGVVFDVDEPVQESDDLPDDARHGRPPSSSSEAKAVPQAECGRARGNAPRTALAACLVSAIDRDEEQTWTGPTSTIRASVRSKSRTGAGRERASEAPACAGKRADSSSIVCARSVVTLALRIEEQMHKRPYVAVGAAVGVGFVLGSLLGSRLGQALVAAGVGYVVKNVVGGDIGVERIEQGIEKLTGERTQA